ncbi:MAG: hypothetical protein IIC76_14915 [Bacteroidetes bacterium]|nr:hypothetical protein [Bacteroidota bacterium]
MKKEDITKDLSNNCPECKAKLYAYYHENVSGDKCTGTWNVECTKCDYIPVDHCFGSIDSMREEFIIVKTKNYERS